MIKCNYKNEYNYFLPYGSMMGVYKNNHYLLKEFGYYSNQEWRLVVEKGQRSDFPKLKFGSDIFPYTFPINPYELSSVYWLSFRGVYRDIEVYVRGQDEKLSQLLLEPIDLYNAPIKELGISPTGDDYYSGRFIFSVDEKEVPDVWEYREPIGGFQFNFAEPEKVYLKKDGVWINE